MDTDGHGWTQREFIYIPRFRPSINSERSDGTDSYIGDGKMFLPRIPHHSPQYDLGKLFRDGDKMYRIPYFPRTPYFHQK